MLFIKSRIVHTHSCLALFAQHLKLHFMHMYTDGFLQAVLIGSQLWVFGGEDSSRRPQADLHCLDLTTMTWSSPALAPGSKQPAARSAAGCAAYAGRYMVVFGGVHWSIVKMALYGS